MNNFKQTEKKRKEVNTRGDEQSNIPVDSRD